MPNRYTVKEHDTLYKFIAARDGDHCLICRVVPAPEKPLQIDHADNNPSNWEPGNLHLCCQICNTAFRNMPVEEHLELIALYSASNESVRVRERGTARTDMVREMVDYNSGSMEMQANAHFEVSYRVWLLETIRQRGYIEKEESLNSGAEKFGCSPQSCNRYLNKLKSGEGPLKETKDATGTKIISFK